MAREQLNGNKSEVIKLINIQTKNGVVYLIGTATNETQKQNTIMMLQGMKGVKDIQLMIKTKY